MKPPFNLEAVESATVEALRRGHRVFQTHQFGTDDYAQVSFLLDMMTPAHGALVLDAGCGIGEVSRLMSELRPDLSFIMTNVSPLQLSMCPEGPQFGALLDDCHDMKFEDGTFDAAMYSSVLCQLDTDIALSEAFRVLVDGGVLLISDMARSSGSQDEMEAAIAARVLPAEELLTKVEAAGFLIEAVIKPEFVGDLFDSLLAECGLSHMAGSVYPIVIRAKKGRVAL